MHFVELVGLSIGLTQCGFDVRAGFDNDFACISTLRLNPSYIAHKCIHANITDMLRGRLLAETGLKEGSLDLLAGGPPCQAFSIQRTSTASTDSNKHLVLEFGQLILEFKPKFFLMENVPGIRGKRGAETLRQFIG